MDKRVRSLEEMMADLIATSENTSRIVAQTSVAMKEFGDRVDRSIEEGRADRMNSKEAMQADRQKSAEEMSKFQEEMEANRRKSDERMSKFQEEMQEDRRSFKEEMREFREAMQADRKKSGEETHEFKNNMASFKEEMRLDRRELNKELGEIANKQGRMAEDLVAPSICRILRDTFKISALYECAANVRHKQIHPEDSGRMKEFDVIAICGDYVMVNETKSNPNASDIRKLRKTIRKFREYFPEHKDKKIVGSLGTLYAHKSLIRYASSKGILVLAVGDELMDVMNEPGFVPTEF
jgi:hypothetical protein